MKIVSLVILFCSLLKKKVLFTEKTTNRLENNKYTFDVIHHLTKSQIKKLFKKIYNIEPIKINSYKITRKKVRLLTSQGYKKKTKRIIITLPKTQKLPLDIS